jgi:tetratricopeptide (TPR) repeat protein
MPPARARFRLVCSSACVAVFVFVACVARAELPKPKAGSGAFFLRGGSYEEAIEVFREEIEKSPDDAAPVRGLAEALAETGKYDEARKALSSSKLFDKATTLRSFAGRTYLRTGMLAEAEKAFRSAIDLDGENVEALNRLGEVLHLTGRSKEATKTWNSVIDVYQGMSSAAAESLPAEGYVEMGLALIHLNRYEEANDIMFAQAVDQDAENPAMLLETGRILQTKFEFPASRGCYRDAFKVNPLFPDGRVAMAENYLVDFQVGTKRYELAEKSIAQALEVNPNHDGAYTARGSLWISDGDLPKARQAFEQAIARNPANIRAHGLLAACHFLDNENEKFKESEAKVLAINKECAEFYHTVAAAIERRFRYLDAARMSEKALALDEDYWPAYHTLGINLLRVGDEEKARFYLAKSFKLDPFNLYVGNTRKLLRYMDKNHRVLKTGKFVIKLPKSDYEVLKTYLVPLLKEAYTKLEKHYQTELDPPVFIEVFSGHRWFSTRIVGLAGFPASGACFGNLVALTTPKALPQNWGAVAWHEFAHVITLHKTHHRVPRWLTEGLSVFEEGRDHPAWERRFEREIGSAYASGRLLGIGELDFGFSKPKYPGQVMMSYYQGCMIVKYIVKTWSFDKVLGVLEGYDANKTTPQIFKDVFGVSLKEFDSGFFTYLADWIEKSGYVPAVSDDAIEDLQLDLEDDPKNVKKLVDLAWAYYCSSLSDEVDVPITANKALQVDPKNGDAKAILALHNLKKGKIATAKEQVESALENGTRFRYRMHEVLAKLALKDGEKEKAIELMEKAKAISPLAGAGSPPGRNLYYSLISLYNEVGKEEEAIRTLEEVRAFSVEDAGCRIKLADHYIQENTPAAAEKVVEILDEVIFINPFDAKVHDKLARASVIAKRHSITVREYDLMLRAYPNTGLLTAHLALARAHLALGDKAAARKHAQEVLDIDDESEEARVILEKAKDS